jgi:hypothetical protein
MPVHNSVDKIFYSDSNMTKLPIYTASKGIEPTDREIILKDGKTKLYISYGKRVPTIFDRKIQATIEYLFYKRYKDHALLTEEALKEIDGQTAKYIEYRKSKFDEAISKSVLTEAQQQQITFTSMKIIKERFNLHLSLTDINNHVFFKYRDVGQIIQSIETLSQTRIKKQTTYSLGGEKVVFEISEMPLIDYSVTFENNKNHYIISLNPFSLYNIITKDYIDFDLNYLISFKKPIAARLAEYFKPLFYGSRKYNRKSRKFDYTELCKYLLITEHKAKSLILQQMKDAFSELKSKGVIFHWTLNKALFGWEIEVWISLTFFEEYYRSLDEDIKQKLEIRYTELSPNSEFRKQIDEFINNLDVNNIPQRYRADNCSILREYYGRYLCLESDNADLIEL